MVRKLFSIHNIGRNSCVSSAATYTAPGDFLSLPITQFCDILSFHNQFDIQFADYVY